MGYEDVSEMWRDRKEESKQRRGSNRASSAALLESSGIMFESKNGGAHLVVTGENGLIDFWPGTGRWTIRNGYTAFGVRKLIKFIKG